MASVKVRTVVKMVETEVEDGVTLELTQREAQALHRLLWCHIAGKPTISGGSLHEVIVELNGVYKRAPAFRSHTLSNTLIIDEDQE